MSEKQLAVQETAVSTRGVQLTSYAELKEFARDVANSGLAPNGLKTPEAILVALQHGMELGLSPSQALQSIAVINGRPCVFGDAALGIVKGHPECVDIVETIDKEGDDLTATCIVYRRDKQPVARKFSVAMAKKAKLWDKPGPWQLYPARMLAMRARSFALRDAFADALKGIAIGEEQRDVQTEKVANAREVKPANIVFPDEETPPAGVIEAEASATPRPYLEGGDEQPAQKKDADGNYLF